jgi:hypothetical protein
VTTLKQIRMLAGPLLARNPDLALVRDMIVVKPVEHFLRFILIERTGNANVCDPRWASSILFSKLIDVPIGETKLLFRSGPPGLWSWSDPTMIDAFVEAVEREVLPKLRAIRTIQDHLDATLTYDRKNLVYEWSSMVVCSIAMGDLDRVRALLAEERGAEYIEALNNYSNGLGTRLFASGGELGRDDRLKLAQRLHENEARSVETLKLGRVWKSTPFPIETLPAKS